MKTLLLALLLLPPTLLYAQEETPRKFTYGFEVAAQFVTSGRVYDDEQSGNSLKLYADYIISQQLHAGLSLGLNSSDAYEMRNIPIEAQLKAYLLKRSCSPFAIARAGYAIQRPTVGSHGPMASIGAGYRIKFRKTFKLIPSVGYNLYQASFSTSEWDENRNVVSVRHNSALSTINFSLMFEW